MTAQRLGYGRVSTLDQNLEAQADALTKAGADKVFIEKITDRLGRSTKDLLAIASELEERGVELEVLEQNINTKTPEGKLFFTMIAAMAEFEHSLMVARTKDGLAAARARGRLGGRKPKLTQAQKKQVKKLYDERELTVREIADMFNITPPTVYRALELIAD